ncbi:MAG: hypothetical protein Q8K75_08065 [Chlamydiales bacterium]|nr:hypothetical protein [Chlamydiales bacterium]
MGTRYTYLDISGALLPQSDFLATLFPGLRHLRFLTLGYYVAQRSRAENKTLYLLGAPR